MERFGDIDKYTREEMLEIAEAIKRRIKELNSKQNIKLYNKFLRMTKDIQVPLLRREIELTWCKERCGLITAGEREKMLNELLKKSEVESQSHST